MKFKTVASKTFFALLLMLSVSLIVQAQVTAIRAGKIVDPETATVLSNQIILVEGQNIKSIGASERIPTGSTLIDLSKYTVLPGLFDAHTHLCWNLRLNDY